MTDCYDRLIFTILIAWFLQSLQRLCCTGIIALMAIRCQPYAPPKQLERGASPLSANTAARFDATQEIFLKIRAI
jgi:hypothetical protein